MKRMFRIIVIILIISSLISHSPQQVTSQNEQVNQLKVLILYQNESEMVMWEQILGQLDANLSTSHMKIENNDYNDLSTFDVTIFSAVEEFNLTTSEQLQLSQFLTSDNSTSLLFTPHLELFNTSILDVFGITDVKEPVPDHNTTVWQIDGVSGSSWEDESFSYEGQLPNFNFSDQSSAVLEAVSADPLDSLDEDLVFPIPAMLNMTTSTSQLIFSAMSSITPSFTNENDSEPESLGIDQILSFEDFLHRIVTTTVQYHIQNYQFAPIITDIDHSSDNTNDTSNSLTNPTDANSNETNPQQRNNNFFIPEFDPALSLLVLLLSLAIVFFRKILDFIQWLYHKILRYFVLIIGAYYNVQDRILSPSDIFANQIRSNIIEYLEVMEGFGAHMRELKNVLGTGSGALLWHLQVLIDYNWITEIKVGRFTIYVLSDNSHQFDPEFRKLENKFRSKYTAELLDLISTKQCQSVSCLKKTENLHNRAIRRLTKRLEKYEMISFHNDNDTFEIIDAKLLNKLSKVFNLRENFKFANSSIDVKSQEKV